MPTPDQPIKSGRREWLEPLLWTLGMAAIVVVAGVFNLTVREALLQGLAYLFTFLTTPFVLEATTAFVGLCIVMAINNRRLAREGDGWVLMEVKNEEAENQTEEKKKESEA